jgi:hypothetical protein
VTQACAAHVRADHSHGVDHRKRRAGARYGNEQGRQVVEGFVVIRSTGPSARNFPAGKRLANGQMIQLRAGDRITAVTISGEQTFSGPGSFRIEEESGSRTRLAELFSSRQRMRTGAVRSSGDDTAERSAPRPIIFRVASGSDTVLQRIPQRTVVSRTSRICLSEGEQITLIGTNGQRVTYTGPGCARRNSRPTGTNPGGFVFGWNRSGGAPTMEVVP